MADRPDFPAIAKHLRALKPYGSGLTVDYLEQVTRYALELERELDEVHVEQAGGPRSRTVEPAWPPRPAPGARQHR